MIFRCFLPCDHICSVESSVLTNGRLEQSMTFGEYFSLGVLIGPKHRTSAHLKSTQGAQTYRIQIKKVATLFSSITLAFLSRYLYFLHQWKEE